MFKSPVVRLIIFSLIVGGAIYWFAQGQMNTEPSQVKGKQTEKLENLKKEFGSKMPPIIDKQVKKLTNELLPQSKEIIEDSELSQEIEAKVNEAMEDLKGFSEEQKKEIKKQIIRQIADQLIKQIEENE